MKHVCVHVRLSFDVKTDNLQILYKHMLSSFYNKLIFDSYQCFVINTVLFWDKT